VTETYSIRTTHPDVRVLKTFEVTGKDEEECLKKAEEEFETFIEDLRLEPE